MNEKRLIREMDTFEKYMGPLTTKIEAPASLYEDYRDVLPGALLRFWERFGLSSFSNGLFWITNPDDYSGLLDMWLEDTHYPEVDTYHVIGRSAFGKLYAWGEKNNQRITINTPSLAIVAQEKEIRTPESDPDLAVSNFFSIKEKKSFDMKNENREPMFEHALAKLGPLDADEMYGFEPFLFAGGELSVDSLTKVKLQAHLMIARQLGGAPSSPFADVGVNID